MNRRKNVLEKLFKIQQELKVPKNQRNTFGNYNFRNCEDIMEASKPICEKHNSLLTCGDKVNQIGERYYVEATATLYDLDSGESISVTASAREEDTKKGMDASQITGASSSYARKYALNGLLQLDDNKDADTNEYQKQQKSQTTSKPQQQNKLISDAQKKLINTLLSQTEDRDKIKQELYKEFNITTIVNVSGEIASKMIDYLNKKVKK